MALPQGEAHWTPRPALPLGWCSMPPFLGTASAGSPFSTDQIVTMTCHRRRCQETLHFQASSKYEFCVASSLTLTSSLTCHSSSSNCGKEGGEKWMWAEVTAMTLKDISVLQHGKYVAGVSKGIKILRHSVQISSVINTFFFNCHSASFPEPLNHLWVENLNTFFANHTRTFHSIYSLHEAKVKRKTVIDDMPPLSVVSAWWHLMSCHPATCLCPFSGTLTQCPLVAWLLSETWHTPPPY